MLVQAITTNTSYEFAAEVRAGLTRKGQKELPSKYLYDDVGSALFEVISHLPEYGLTRADERLLRRHAGEIVERLDAPVAVAELGSGSGKKTRWILEALSRLATHILLSGGDFAHRLWRCARRNSAISIRSALWVSSANISMGCWRSRRIVSAASIFLCCFWAARLAISIVPRE